MIEAEALTRSYDDFKAVDDVSFTIGQGEVVGLLGHNAAGKTTIMKMLTGYLEPSEGRVTIDGRDMASQRQTVQHEIGYLPESCPLYTDMAVVDYLAYCATLQGVPEADRPEAIREAIGRTALDDKALARIGTLSRGYCQRVGVAQAILHRPRTIILDEPTNGLDPSQVQHMRDLILELAENATVIVSTHILQEVEAVCERVLMIRDGELALDARLADLSGADCLQLTVDGDSARVRDRLGNVAGITSVEPGRVADGQHHYRLGLDGSAPGDIAPAVADAVQAAGMKLYTLRPEVRDLESVFREVNDWSVNHGPSAEPASASSNDKETTHA